MTTLTNDSAVNQRILAKLVEREVLHCISSTVSHFAQNPDSCVDSVDYDDVLNLLSTPNYEQAGLDHIATLDRDELLDIIDDTSIDENASDDELRELAIETASNDWSEFCSDNRLDPEDDEALEHWAVTSWFKGKLAEHGAITGDLLDFDVWGRTCSGQSISMDGVILAIAAEMEILDGQKHSWAD